MKCLFVSIIFLLGVFPGIAQSKSKILHCRSFETVILDNLGNEIGKNTQFKTAITVNIENRLVEIFSYDTMKIKILNHKMRVDKSENSIVEIEGEGSGGEAVNLLLVLFPFSNTYHKGNLKLTYMIDSSSLLYKLY